jgi:hypothetical protein
MQDKDQTSSILPAGLTDDEFRPSDDIVSLDGSLESSISSESVDPFAHPELESMLVDAFLSPHDIPITARNSTFFLEDELCRFKVRGASHLTSEVAQAIYVGLRRVLSGSFTPLYHTIRESKRPHIFLSSSFRGACGSGGRYAARIRMFPFCPLLQVRMMSSFDAFQAG